MHIVYISGPFRGANSWEVEQNVRHAEEVALKLWLNGIAVICPHANTRFFDGVGKDKIFLEGDLAIIERLQEGDAVLFIDGWERSSGARWEYRKAREDWMVKKGVKTFFNVDKCIKELMGK